MLLNTASPTAQRDFGDLQRNLHRQTRFLTKALCHLLLLQGCVVQRRRRAGGWESSAGCSSSTAQLLTNTPFRNDFHYIQHLQKAEGHRQGATQREQSMKALSEHWCQLPSHFSFPSNISVLRNKHEGPGAQRGIPACTRQALPTAQQLHHHQISIHDSSFLQAHKAGHEENNTSTEAAGQAEVSHPFHASSRTSALLPTEGHTEPAAFSGPCLQL